MRPRAFVALAIVAALCALGVILVRYGEWSKELEYSLPVFFLLAGFYFVTVMDARHRRRSR